MTDTVIQCFRADFDRFYDMMEKQLASVPDDLWLETAGGFPVWQQYMHTFASIEFYATREEGQAWKDIPWTGEELMLCSVPATPMTKAEVLTLASRMRECAYAFMEGMTVADLTRPHPGMMSHFKRLMTDQNALLAMIRHTCYHLGAIDAILRQRGLPGSY